MKSKILAVIATALVLLLLFSAVALAMSSANYTLNWFTPLSGGGGGSSNSTSYTANITIGQSATGSSSSANYKASLGYWAGIGHPYLVFLPIQQK